MAAGPAKSFADLQRELIAAQMEQRKAATREAAASSWRMLTDDIECAPAPAKLTVVEG